MGRRCYLWIVNATSKTLKLTRQHSHQMKNWKFGDVKADTRLRFYIEFDEGLFHTHTNDAGEAEFRLEGTNQYFRLQAHWLRDGPSLWVDWSGTNTSCFTVFPPPVHEESSGFVGWLGWSWGSAGSSLPFRHGKAGTLCMLIQEKGRTAPLPVVGDCTPEADQAPLPVVGDCTPEADQAPLPVVGDCTPEADQAPLPVVGDCTPDADQAPLPVVGDCTPEADQAPLPVVGDCTPEADQAQLSSTFPASTVSEDLSSKELASQPDISHSSIPQEAMTRTQLKVASSRMTSVAVLNRLEQQWMEYYSDIIGKLTLTELTLAGTHNSGTYQPVAVYPASEIIRTQSLSLYDQLNLGIRVLDLRIGQNWPGNYIISHDKYRTRYSLSGALQEVKDFIRTTQKEIVILDFHRFNNLGDGEFDFDQLKTQVKSSLEGYYLLPVSQGHTLSKIWQTCGQQRIVVAWNDGRSHDSTYMWAGVRQSWYQHADTVDKLTSAIESDMSSPPEGGMWSAGVFLASSYRTGWQPIKNAKILTPIIDNWFYGCADWTLKANIISTNFFHRFNHSVQASISASILKAGCKE